MEPTCKLYGFFSQMAYDSGCGASYYRSLEGREVLVTVVDKSLDAPSYVWSDKKCIGEVLEFLRQDPTHQTVKYFEE